MFMMFVSDILLNLFGVLFATELISVFSVIVFFL